MCPIMFHWKQSPTLRFMERSRGDCFDLFLHKISVPLMFTK